MIHPSTVVNVIRGRGKRGFVVNNINIGVEQLANNNRDVESQSPGVRVLAWSRSRSFEGDSESGPYLSHLDFCVMLLQYIQLLSN